MGLLSGQFCRQFPRTRTNDILFDVVGRLTILSGSTIRVKFDSQTANPMSILLLYVDPCCLDIVMLSSAEQDGLNFSVTTVLRFILGII